MKKFRYYIESASGVRSGVLIARDKQHAEQQVKESFERNHPSESMWVWFVVEE